jgi:hypothetical protein
MYLQLLHGLECRFLCLKRHPIYAMKYDLREICWWKDHFRLMDVFIHHLNFGSKNVA